MKICIPRRIPSQNQRDQWHWSRRHAERNAWVWYVRKSVGVLPIPTGRKRVHVISYRRYTCRDIANLIGGAKGLIDALVACNVLVDDADMWADITYEQRKPEKGDGDRTEIEVETA